MILPRELERALKPALDGQAPGKEQCAYLLGPPEHSLEASALTAVADPVSRRRSGNAGILLGQIGVDTAACPGDCRFCVFGKVNQALHSAYQALEKLTGYRFMGERDSSLRSWWKVHRKEYVPVPADKP